MEKDLTVTLISKKILLIEVGSFRSSK